MDNKKLNKYEAAEYLGVSTRSLANYVKQGEIKVYHVSGKHGLEGRYELQDLEAYKARREEPIQKAVVESQSKSKESESKDLITVSQQMLPAVGEYISHSLQSLSFAPARQRALALTEIAVKPVLKLEEASLLTGLPRDFLRQAITQGQLKAKKVGKSWRLLRSHLDTFLEAMFD